MASKTIDTPNARRLAEAAAIRGAAIIGQPGGWSVMLKIGMQETPLGTQRTDKPRSWSSLDTCMQYLRDELGIVRIDGIDASNYSAPTVYSKRRADAAERMKRAHEAAAHDAWFREQVQASIEDQRPSIPHDEARASFADRKAALRKRAK
ncbi:hypothetical protein [Acidithiobacillus sulfuriphilus]|uniref:Stability determinant domain-containing protein n=2 Tax=Acidithiobacillus sulfuriphilus TaxID=1867749 RepID=A0A3M8RWM1_9PROT|nr:hypothetical protein [Acidithiobacillus sulfuriphilus]RNF72821.1 hypothetical protein EC580_01105 [Acidithiobacillus sulfuriphilus]